MSNLGNAVADPIATATDLVCVFCAGPCREGICDACFQAKTLQAADLQQEFLSGKPYPHIVIDGLFDDRVLDGLVRRFPKPTADAKVRDKHQPGKHAWDMDKNPAAGRLQDPEIIGVLGALSSNRMVKIAEAVTGIRNLEGDPTYYGAGLHQLVTGGHLDVHTDFRRMFKGSPKFRRVNMLIYLNRDWKQEYGAAFEMWNNPPTQSKKAVLPEFNRTVIFPTTGTSWHGHPHPMTCPPDVTRKSIALYFYSDEPGEQDLKDLPVQWLGGAKKMYHALRSKLTTTFSGKR
jgi:hypothetical protein